MDKDEFPEYNPPSKFQYFQRPVLDRLKNDNFMNGTKIYQHQREALLRVQVKFDEDEGQFLRPALLRAPTGAGKSGIIALLPYVLGAKKVLVLSPSLKITEQLQEVFGITKYRHEKSFVAQTGFMEQEKLKNFLVRGAVMQNTEEASKLDWDADLIIANAHKFGTRGNARLGEPEEDDEQYDEIMEQILRVKESFSSLDLLVVDEAHHYPAKTWDLICQQFEGKRIVFLTATPYRGKNKDPLWEGQKVTWEVSLQTLTNLHITRPIRFKIFPALGINNVDVEQLGKGILAILHSHDATDNRKVHKAMILVLRDAEAQSLAGKLDKATYHSCTAPAGNLESFEKGPKRILVVCGSLLEGYDNEAVSVCVILRKVGSPSLFTQFVGRALRRVKPGEYDDVHAVVLTYTCYNQETLVKDFKKDNGLQ